MTHAHRTQVSAHSGAHDDPPVVFTLSEAAEHLGVSRNALRMRVARGTMPSFRVGRRLFVRLDSTSSAPRARTSARTTARTAERTVRAHDRARVQWLEGAITQLQAEVSWLRQRLEAAEGEREQAAVERAELRRLLAAGVPALPVGRAERPENRGVSPPLAVRLSRAWRAFWRR